MKIAVSAQEKSPQSPVDPRFGRAACFMIFDDAEEKWAAVDNQQNLQAAQGAGIQSAANLVNAGCDVLISGHCGPKAFAALSKAGVQVFTMRSGTVSEAVEAFRRGELEQLAVADVEGHW